MDDFEKRNIALSEEIERLYKIIDDRNNEISQLQQDLIDLHLREAGVIMGENKDVLRKLADS